MTRLVDIESLTLVGAGNMGAAMLDGWLAGGLRGDVIEVVDPNPDDERRARWQTQGVEIVPAPGQRQPDVMMVAVKPQIFEEAIEATRASVGEHTVVISVVAGAEREKLRSAYGLEARCIRAMPNTPSQVGRGITVCCPTVHVDEADRAVVDTLMGAVGTVEWVESENWMDAVTGVSGSGPAYVFHLVEALAAAGVEAGLPQELAERLARATVAGGGELLWQATESAEELRQNVTSPAGTTQAGLDVLMPELTDLIRRTVAAAAKRSQELG